ncbi:hypothetical protein [Halobacillus dabanensis]|nr:hypothetical protein [Halobacillus dabanensis]
MNKYRDENTGAIAGIIRLLLYSFSCGVENQSLMYGRELKCEISTQSN